MRVQPLHDQGRVAPGARADRPVPLFRGARQVGASSLLFMGLLVVAPVLGTVSAADAEEFRVPISGKTRKSPVVEVVEKVKASVVNIHSERAAKATSFDDLTTLPAQSRVNGMGTGIIIDPRGYIVTNHHVVDEVTQLRVRTHDGTSYAARVIARDPVNDLAVLKVDARTLLPTIALGTANDLMVGEPVIAVGNAYGYEHTVTTGVVSAVKRDVSLNKEISYKSLIQTDASINPGNSGGPLLNIHGELIGVNVAIRAGAQGIGFAIPVDAMIRATGEMLSLKRRAGVVHGLVVRDLVQSGDGPAKRWVVVDRCESGSPAERAGVQPGDVIESIGDVTVRTSLDIERSFVDRSVGDKLPVTVRRGGDTVALTPTSTTVKLELTLTAPEKTHLVGTELIWRKLGIRVQPVGPEAVVRVNPQLHGGLLITEVNADAPAGRSGFARGDILIGLHQWETISPENVTFVLNHPELATFSPVRYFLVRAGQIKRGWLQQLD